MFRRCRRSSALLVLSGVVYFIFIAIITYLLDENSALRLKVATFVCPKETRESNVPLRSNLTNRLSNRKKTPRTMARNTPREFIQTSLTFVLLKEAGTNDQSAFFNNRLQDLRKKFPSSSFTWSKEHPAVISTAFNSVIAQVKTEYFLVLEPRAMLSDRQEESIAHLWNALEEFPELDFVGGSYLSNEKLYVPCYRFRLCKWTFSETYEYERSLDNVMICDGISSSFMGRTDSVRKVKGGFDPNLSNLLVVKDFFLRAKTSNITAGTRPNVVFVVDHFKRLHQLWSSRKITKELVPFAVKHKVFKFKDIDGKVIDICSATSPLSGKSVCIEQNSHKLMLGGGHWAYKGLFAYPYLVKYLEITLSEISDYFNRHNVTYFVEGGVSLGAIKMRSILPWDSGDIDIFVYDLSLGALYNLLEPLAKQKGYIVRLRSDQVHVFCTPSNVGDLSGGIATILPAKTKAPPRSELIKVQTNGIWISYKRYLVSELIGDYGKGYLEHKMFRSSETMECKIKGHNACLPNFKTFLKGKAGTSREYFCDI